VHVTWFSTSISSEITPEATSISREELGLRRIEEGRDLKL